MCLDWRHVLEVWVCMVPVCTSTESRWLALQVAAWGMHCRDFKENWVTGKHDYIIKSAVSSGLISIISNALAADAQFSTVEGHV